MATAPSGSDIATCPARSRCGRTALTAPCTTSSRTPSRAIPALPCAPRSFSSRAARTTSFPRTACSTACSPPTSCACGRKGASGGAIARSTARSSGTCRPTRRRSSSPSARPCAPSRSNSRSWYSPSGLGRTGGSMPRVTTPRRRPAFNPRRNIVPDRLDLRDRPYVPVLHQPPPPAMEPQLERPVLDQGKTNACTGFALASVVNFLLRKHRDPKTPPMSAYMLYSMSRRYDEFPGASEDSGSSLRGAMKGWFKHGVCRLDLWDRPDMPPPSAKPEDDWWLDAARRPLGAYYRVDTRSVTDMHVALHDAGVLYASAICHDGWLRGRGAGGGAAVSAGGRRGAEAPPAEARLTDYWTIPPMEASSDAGGHAFVILG